MEKNSSTLLKVGVLAVIFSTVMLFLIYLNGVGKGIVNSRETNQVAVREFELQELIYKFSNKSQDGGEVEGLHSKRKVSGSDIVNLILKYNDEFKYYVAVKDESETGIGIVELNGKKYREYSGDVARQLFDAGKDGDEIWTLKYLTDHIILNSDIGITDSVYYSHIEGYEVRDLKFIFDNTVSYKIKFNGNGNDTGISAIVEMPEQTMVYESATPLLENVFSKEGYIFIGWSKTPNGPMEYADEADGSTITSVDGATVTLYAVWKSQLPQFNITYDFDGGYGSYNPTMYTQGGSPVNIGKASRDGYEFIGWTGSNGSTPQLNVEIPSTSSGEKHYKANWKPKGLELSIDTDGGTYSGDNPVTLSIGNTVTLGSISKPGYKFTGWRLTGSTGTLSGNTFTMGKSSSSVKAEWTPNHFTIVFNNNGGSGTMSNQSVTYGSSTAISRNTFVRSGYVFAGWGYTNSDDVKLSDMGAAGTLTTVDNGTVTLYAKWKPEQFGLTINASGGKYEGQNIKTVKLDYGNVLNLANPVREGYTFSGWKIKTGNGSLSGSKFTMGAGNTEVEAVWTINQYELITSFVINEANNGSASGVGTFDLYINGTLVQNDVSDINLKYNYGTTYEIKDIKGVGTYSYTNIRSDSKPLSGTVGAGGKTTEVIMLFDTKVYTVRLDSQNGTQIIKNKVVVDDSAQVKKYTVKHGGKIPSGWTPSMSGWTFLGWFDINDNPVNVTNVAITSNVTYYAHWSKDFGYTGNIQSAVLPVKTNYFFETWGAQGSAILDGVAGLGGYTSGYRQVGRTTIYVGVGGQNGYNGGANGGTPGGGATHMAYMNGTLQSLRNSSSTVTKNGVTRTVSNDAQVLVVAGGGGASERPYIRGGHGGGATGEDAQYTDAAQGAQRNDVGHLVGAWLPVKAGSYYLGVMTGGGLSSGSMDWCTNYGNYESSSNITVLERTDTRRAFRFYVPTGIRPDSRSSNLDPYSIWEVRIVNPSSSAWANTVYIRLNSSDIQEARDALTYLMKGKGGSQTAGGAGEASPNYSPFGNMTGSKGLSGSASAGDAGSCGGGGWYGGGATTFAGAGGGGSSYYQILKNPRADRGVRSGNGYAKITILSPNEKYS